MKFDYEIDLDRLPSNLKQYKSDLEHFTPQDLQFLRWRMLWKSMAREKQLPPKEFENFEKMIWGIRSGRGFGKTLTGSNWLGIEAYGFPSMYCVVAPTKDDVRYTCFEGPTGLYAVIPPQLIIDKNLALPSITLYGGSIIRGFAGDTPERLRGPQHAKGWLDEIACLVPRTLVRTSRGEVPIEHIRVGDLVWTRAGLRRVLAAGVSSTEAELWEMTASDGSRLVGTGHHPIWSANERRFIPLHSLRHGTTLAMWQTSSFGTENVGTGGASATRIAVAEHFTAQSTNTIEGHFRKGTESKSITATRIRVTTEFLTWWRSLIQNTNDFIPKGLFFGANDAPLEHVGLSGLRDSLEWLSVSSARSAIDPQGSDRSSVLRSAETSRTDTREQSTSVVSVRALGRRGVVYNLDVEDAHEFYANGILTHNSWLYPQDALDNLMFGLRLGAHPQLCVTGTPKPSVFIRDMTKRKDAVWVVGSTYENRENLTPAYFENVSKYEGTRKGRQEIHGEVLDPEEAGIVKRSQWKRWPTDKPLPRFQYIVYSLDTAFTEKDHDKKKQKSDPTACSVWGLFSHGTPAKKNIILLDCWEEWLGFPALIKRVKKERSRRYGAIAEGPAMLRPLIAGKQVAEAQGKKIDLILIEDKASGRSLIQSLADEEIFAEPYNPGGQDKLERLNDTARLWTHGRVWAVESALKPGEFRNWAEPLIAQVCTYSGEGSLEHDDLLDTATQAAKYFLDNHIGSLTIPRDEEEERRKAAAAAKQKLEAARKRNPYDG